MVFEELLRRSSETSLLLDLVIVTLGFSAVVLSVLLFSISYLKNYLSSPFNCTYDVTLNVSVQDDTSIVYNHLMERITFSLLRLAF